MEKSQALKLFLVSGSFCVAGFVWSNNVQYLHQLVIFRVLLLLLLLLLLLIIAILLLL